MTSIVKDLREALKGTKGSDYVEIIMPSSNGVSGDYLSEAQEKKKDDSLLKSTILFKARQMRYQAAQTGCNVLSAYKVHHQHMAVLQICG